MIRFLNWFTVAGMLAVHSASIPALWFAFASGNTLHWSVHFLLFAGIIATTAKLVYLREWLLVANNALAAGAQFVLFVIAIGG